MIDNSHIKMKIKEFLESSVSLIDERSEMINKELQVLKKEYSNLIDTGIYLIT